MADQPGPELSQEDRVTARKALWDLRAEVAQALDSVMLRRATYASLHQSLAAVDARTGQLRLALGTAEAGQPVSGPLRAARECSPALDPAHEAMFCPRCRHHHDPEFGCSDDCVTCMAEDDPEGAR